MSKDPIAFWSYAHADDAHDGGRISALRTRLSGEAQIQLGREFPIFQDRDHITWGQQWKRRIDDSLDAVTFLLPVITPTFLVRPECRREIERFLERENALGRKDLILPIYYVDCSQLNGDAPSDGVGILGVLKGRQYFDFRAHRHEPLTSPEMGRLLTKIAKQLIDAIDRPGSERSSKEVQFVESLPRSNSSNSNVSGDATSGLTSGPSRMVDPPTHIVDAMHRGHFPSLSEAISFAKPGDRIILRRGTYRESVIISKPLEILGDGELGDVVIEAASGSVIVFQSTMGRLSNLAIRQRGTENFFGIDISQGRLDIDGCDITSTSFSGIVVRGGADPRLRHNRIHNSRQAGVLFIENSMGALEENEIFENTFAGIEVSSGSNPTIRRNRFHSGKAAGLYVHNGATATIEDNEIFANGSCGISIKSHGNPTITRNRIHHQKQAGIFVYEEGEGIIENNDIQDNGGAGIQVMTGGNPQIRDNRINRNEYEAVWVNEGGKGTFVSNDVRENKRGAWDISEDCKTLVKQSNNREK